MEESIQAGHKTTGRLQAERYLIKEMQHLYEEICKSFLKAAEETAI